jgi:hypothetical protein
MSNKRQACLVLEAIASRSDLVPNGLRPAQLLTYLSVEYGQDENLKVAVDVILNKLAIFAKELERG